MQCVASQNLGRVNDEENEKEKRKEKDKKGVSMPIKGANYSCSIWYHFLGKKIIRENGLYKKGKSRTRLKGITRVRVGRMKKYKKYKRKIKPWYKMRNNSQKTLNIKRS